MTALTGLASLLSLADRPASDDDLLSVHIGRAWEDVEKAINSETMPDGLSRESLRLLIRDRGVVLIGDERLAECASHLVALIAPLAADCAEIDAAIHVAADWLRRLGEDGLFEEIVAAKVAMQEDGLENGPPEDADEATVAVWNELFDGYVADCEHAQITMEVGGRDVLVTLEQDCTLVVVETVPDSDDFRLLAVFDHSGDWGGGDDDEDEPEPDPDPVRPETLDA